MSKKLYIAIHQIEGDTIKTMWCYANNREETEELLDHNLAVSSVLLDVSQAISVIKDISTALAENEFKED